MATEAGQPVELTDVDTDRNRYTNQEDALRRLLDEERFPFTQVDRLELGFLANGEVTVRWRPLGEEEWDGIVFPDPDIR
jgi:hypothetical protein